jgi:hypothetical protein
MNPLDRLIDVFSLKDLRSRVRTAIIAGFLLCAVMAAGLSWMLNLTQRIDLPVSVRWQSLQPATLIISLPPGGAARITDRDSIDLELLDPPNGRIRSTVPVLSLDPQTSLLIADGTTLSPSLQNLTRIDGWIVLLEEKYGTMMMGK